MIEQSAQAHPTNRRTRCLGIVAICALALAANGVAGQTRSVPFVSPESTRSTPADATARSPSSPTSPNPFLSYLPAGVEPDYAYWRARMAADAAERRQEQLFARSVDRGVPLAFAESEPNDLLTTADPLADFGTGSGDNPEATITGTMEAPGAAAGPALAAEGANGTLSGATVVTLVDGQWLTSNGTIGDGPHGSGGSGTGDADFFEFDLEPGDNIVVRGSVLDTVAALIDSNGFLLAFNDADPIVGTFFGSLVTFTARDAGTYYLLLVGYRAGPLFPSDLEDASSGPGVGEEGPYTIEFGLNVADTYAVDLEAGDVLGVSSDVNERLLLTIVGPDGDQRVGSWFTTAAGPPSSPLPIAPTGGVDATDVAGETGTHYIRVVNVDGGSTPYELTAKVFRPPTDATPQPQILFIDFNGVAGLDTESLFGADFDPQADYSSVTLSPLADFLAGWGLGPSDENAVIDAILGVIEENLRSLEAVIESSPGWVLRNSRDHADPFGEPNVSRVIIGGTVVESGLQTIGIAESIDVGNFELAETALVLLDELSASLPNLNSLNNFGGSKIDVIGHGVGNIATHEIGHFIGNWHTDQFNSIPALQDQGGNLPGAVGVGPDGNIGTGDDVDVDFVRDVFNFSEFFSGFEQQDDRAAWGISGPFFVDSFETGDTTVWSP